MSRRFAGVGVGIGAARLREIASGSPASAAELADVDVAVVASEFKHQERVAKFEKREDRKATKKDWAMIKDEVTQRMLKTAPIRPKYLPIMITRGMAYFFTTSPKACDEAGTFLRSVFGTWPMTPVFHDFENLQYFMSEILWGQDAIPMDEMSAEDLQDVRFYPTDSAKLEDKDDAVHSLTKQVLTDRGGIAQSLKEQRHSITIKELAAFIEDNVPELTKQYRGTVQYPSTSIRGMDFPIVILQ